MADFDPNGLTWKVFVNVVREKHGHEIYVTPVSQSGGAYNGGCTRCSITFGPEDRLEKGWMNARWHDRRRANRCPRTRPS